MVFVEVGERVILEFSNLRRLKFSNNFQVSTGFVVYFEN